MIGDDIKSEKQCTCAKSFLSKPLDEESLRARLAPCFQAILVAQAKRHGAVMPGTLCITPDANIAYNEEPVALPCAWMLSSTTQIRCVNVEAHQIAG